MPNALQLHVDTLLSNVSVKYRNQSYVAMEIFPEVPVKKSSDLYRVYDRNFRIPETIRADKAVAREHNFDVSNASYVLEQHALKDYVTDRQAENYDLADLRAETTEELTDKILLRMEKSFVQACVTGTSWSLQLSLTSTMAWNATTTVDPVAHFDTGTVSVVNNSGMMPKIAAMNLQSKFALKNNAQVLDRVKYTSSEVDDKIIARLIGAEKLVISSQVEDTANEGASGGASIQSLWGNKVLFVYAPAAPGPLKPSAGYVFRRNVPLVKRWREEERAGDAIEVNMEYSVKVVASLSGFYIGGTY